MVEDTEDKKIQIVLHDKRSEIIERLNSRISPDVYRETEIIQHKHDMLTNDELLRPFTI